MPRNIDILTNSHKAIAAKKRAKRNQINEIVFDDDARREFLTGFHKRKVAKTEAARAKAKEREKQERLEARREQRRMLREQALENAAQVEKAYGAESDEDEEWSGIGNENTGERDEEYEDEEMLATVTVVEDFDPDTIIHGPPAPIYSETGPQTVTTSNLPIKKKTKQKREKIPYLTRDARRVERNKQHTRRTQKAELAGGKAGRTKSSGHGLRKKGGFKR